MIGAATALGVGLGADTGYTAFQNGVETQSSVYENILTHCAPALGNVATRATELPVECEDAAGYIPYRTTLVEDISFDGKPTLYDNGSTLISEHRVYRVPTRAAFEHKMTELVSQEEREDDNFHKIFVGLSVLTGLAVGNLAYSIADRKRRRELRAIKYSASVETE